MNINSDWLAMLLTMFEKNVLAAIVLALVLLPYAALGVVAYVVRLLKRGK